jgi:hypothetical protein
MGKSIQIADNLNAFGDCRTNFFKFGITERWMKAFPPQLLNVCVPVLENSRTNLHAAASVCERNSAQRLSLNHDKKGYAEKEDGQIRQDKLEDRNAGDKKKIRLDNAEGFQSLKNGFTVGGNYPDNDEHPGGVPCF